MDFRVQVWKPVWKMTFLLWNRVRIWKTRQNTLTKNSKECPPSHPRAKNLSVSKFAHMMKYKLLGQNCAEIYLRYPQLSFLIAKNSTSKLLLSNSLKGKSRHDQFFQQNKSWMCNLLITGWICVALLYQILLKSKETKPQWILVGGSFLWQGQ